MNSDTILQLLIYIYIEKRALYLLYEILHFSQALWKNRLLGLLDFLVVKVSYKGLNKKA